MKNAPHELNDSINDKARQAMRLELKERMPDLVYVHMRCGTLGV